MFILQWIMSFFSKKQKYGKLPKPQRTIDTKDGPTAARKAIEKRFKQ